MVSYYMIDWKNQPDSYFCLFFKFSFLQTPGTFLRYLKKWHRNSDKKIFKQKEKSDRLTDSIIRRCFEFSRETGQLFFFARYPFKDTSYLQRNCHKMYGKILAPNRIDIEETVWLWCYACQLLDAFWVLGFKYFNISLIDSKYCVCK